VVGVADPLDAALGRLDDLLEGVAGQVGQLHALEAGPQRLDRVEVGCVAGQWLHHQLDASNTDTLIQALGQLGRFLGGQKATLLWDGLPAHRSLAMRAWLRRQRSWLVVEPLPGYAPDLNPVEALWSSLKGMELANLAGDTLDDVITAAERGIQRIRDTHHLAYSFLRHCGLSLW
jgi:hypothetical protein